MALDPEFATVPSFPSVPAVPPGGPIPAESQETLDTLSGFIEGSKYALLAAYRLGRFDGILEACRKIGGTK